MPYKLSGTKVVKSDSGEVVKDHPSREKALAHLRALKANVEEGSPAVLGALLEGFDASERRDFHGRWVGTSSGKVLRLFHGQASLGDANPRGGNLTARIAQVAQDAGKSISPVQVRKVLNDAAGSPEPTPRVIPKGGNANELRGGIPRAGLPTSRRATLGRAEGDAAARTRAEILAKSPGAAADLARHQSIASGARRAFDPVTMLGREGTAARERGASSSASEHADTRDKLTNLPAGQTYGLHGPRGQMGRVDRTAKGFEVYGPRAAEPQVHKSPSSAAGHAMRIQRSAAQSPRHADVAKRNYAHYQEVARMNARQAQRAEQEAERQLEIAARASSSSRERGLAQTELERRRGARTPRPRVRESAPEVLGALLEGR